MGEAELIDQFEKGHGPVYVARRVDEDLNRVQSVWHRWNDDREKRIQKREMRLEAQGKKKDGTVVRKDALEALDEGLDDDDFSKISFQNPYVHIVSLFPDSSTRVSTMRKRVERRYETLLFEDEDTAVKLEPFTTSRRMRLH